MDGRGMQRRIQWKNKGTLRKEKVMYKGGWTEGYN